MKVDEQTDEYTAVGHILPKLITNSLARIINYAESGLVKLKFENTKLHEAINCKFKFNFSNNIFLTNTLSILYNHRCCFKGIP